MTRYTDPGHEDELLEWEAATRDAPYEGDPRRCRRHPHVVTSSPDGLFDGLCGECEAEGDEAAERERERDRERDREDLPYGVEYPPLDSQPDDPPATDPDDVAVENDDIPF